MVSAMDWWFWMGIAFIVVVLLLLIIKTILVFPGLLQIHKKSNIDTELGSSTENPISRRSSTHKDPMSRRSSTQKDPMSRRSSTHKDPMSRRSSTQKDPMSRKNRRRSTINKSIQCSFTDSTDLEESPEHLLGHKVTNSHQDNISSQHCIRCQTSRNNSLCFPITRKDSACFSMISRDNSVCFPTSTPPSCFSNSFSPTIHSAPASYPTSHTSREDVTKMAVMEDVTNKDMTDNSGEVQLKMVPAEDGCVIIFKTHKQAEQELEH